MIPLPYLTKRINKYNSLSSTLLVLKLLMVVVRNVWYRTLLAFPFPFYLCKGNADCLYLLFKHELLGKFESEL